MNSPLVVTQTLRRKYSDGPAERVEIGTGLIVRGSGEILPR